MTERVRSQMQASEMRFLRKSKGVAMFNKHLAGLHVSKLRFFLLVLFKRFFFLLTQVEKRAFSQLKAVISAEVRKKKNGLKKNSIKNRNFETCKPANCNCAICKSLDIESLLFRIKRSQLRWFGLVSRTPQKRFPKQTLYAKVSGKTPVGRPRTRWLDYIEDLSWNRLGLYPSEMQSVLVDRKVYFI